MNDERPSTPDKFQVARTLRDISLLLQLRGENAFKARAYDVGADRIAGLTEDLAAIVREQRLQKIPGIGPALAEKITELVTTGQLPYLETLRGEFPLGIVELVQLSEVGPKRAALLWKSLQIGSIAELELACKEGRVRTVKGFGERTEAKLLEGIERYKRSTGRKLMGEVWPRAEALLADLRKVDGVKRASVAGSLRRGCETVSDVDIVVSSENPEPVLAALASHPLVKDILGRGDNKCSVRLGEDDLQVDLRVLPDADFATALHHLTGSKAHHVRLRGLAKDRGLQISEYGVFRGDQKLPVANEAALYALLDMDEIPPELREDFGEVEAAQNHTLGGGWLENGHVQGIVHSHSLWSDGRATIEDMARAAQALGLTYLTVTDHSEAASYAGGLSADRLKRQWEEIDRVNDSLKGFRLLKGLEVDILADGALDLGEDVLSKLECVVASVHVRHSLDEKQMTARVLKALDQPWTHVLGHPTGRLINSREPYPLQIEAVLERAAERGVAVEVNGQPARLDLKSEHVRLALEKGVKLVVSADAHSPPGLEYFKFAVATARKGWARKEDVLNTRDVQGFLEGLRPPGV